MSPLRLVAGQKPEQWQRERAEKANKTIYIICRAVEVRVRCSTVELFPSLALILLHYFNWFCNSAGLFCKSRVGLLV